MDELLSLRKIQGLARIFLVVLTFGAAILGSVPFAWSVFVGGIISLCSFWISTRDVTRLADSVASLSSPEARKSQVLRGPKLYLLKFLLRIVIIGIILVLLIKSKKVNILGLILGLSTFVFTFIYMSIDMTRRYFSKGRS